MKVIFYQHELRRLFSKGEREPFGFRFTPQDDFRIDDETGVPVNFEWTFNRIDGDAVISALVALGQEKGISLINANLMWDDYNEDVDGISFDIR